MVEWQEAPEFFGTNVHLIVEFKGIFCHRFLYKRKLQLTQKYFFFSDSFALRSQATEASYTVDCSIVAMLVIEKSKFLNAFFIVFFGVVFVSLFSI